MADPTTVTATTNTKPNSFVTVQCDCNTMWSMAQQFCTVRLCTAVGPHKGQLLENYAVRARRIAATYARFYLELEDGGDLDKKGRFYWMALGAFASKTVACTLETFQVKALSNLSSTTKEGLGKGNLWLFCDIGGWHWYYTKHPTSFDQCLDSRNAETYVKEVKQQMSHLPWKSDALPKIKNFRVSKEIKAGFAKVKEFENQPNDTIRRQIQFDHLMEIANHEQGVVLQPLIYDDPNFAYWVQTQRSTFVHWASPPLELVFGNNCTIDDLSLKSVAPENTKLEDFKNRMNWINQAANKFHGLMIKYNNYMESEIKIIASWVDTAEK